MKPTLKLAALFLTLVPTIAVADARDPTDPCRAVNQIDLVEFDLVSPDIASLKFEVPDTARVCVEISQGNPAVAHATFVLDGETLGEIEGAGTPTAAFRSVLEPGEHYLDVEGEGPGEAFVRVFAQGPAVLALSSSLERSAGDAELIALVEGIDRSMPGEAEFILPGGERYRVEDPTTNVQTINLEDLSLSDMGSIILTSPLDPIGKFFNNTYFIPESIENGGCTNSCTCIKLFNLDNQVDDPPRDAYGLEAKYDILSAKVVENGREVAVVVEFGETDTPAWFNQEARIKLLVDTDAAGLDRGPNGSPYENESEVTLFTIDLKAFLADKEGEITIPEATSGLRPIKTSTDGKRLIFHASFEEFGLYDSVGRGEFRYRIEVVPRFGEADPGVGDYLPDGTGAMRVQSSYVPGMVTAHFDPLGVIKQSALDSQELTIVEELDLVVARAVHMEYSKNRCLGQKLWAVQEEGLPTLPFFKGYFTANECSLGWNTVADANGDRDPAGVLDLFSQYGAQRINAVEVPGVPSAMSEFGTGTAAVVAVMDTGVASPHVDLDSGRILQGFSTNSRSAHLDDVGHGSMMATIIAASRNQIGIVGVAPDAWILPIR